jgi:hypothetical protein
MIAESAIKTAFRLNQHLLKGKIIAKFAKGTLQKVPQCKPMTITIIQTSG